MTARARSVAIGCAVIVGLVSVAHADPPKVDLSHCTAFDASALRDAIARELPSSGGDRPYAVIVACPDLVTANLHVEPVPDTGAVARSLDLGEVPGDLRIKLLALAIAELAEVAIQLPDPRAPSPTSPIKPRAPADPQSLTDLDPRSDPPPTPTVAAAPPASAPSAGSVAVETAVAPAHYLPFELGPIVGVRMFGRYRTTLLDAGAELSLPWLRVGVRGAVGHGDDPLGTYTPWLATVTVARELVCVGFACGLVRADAGLAGVVANAIDNARAADASSGYASVSLSVELRHRVDAMTLTASFEAGYSAGMIARAEHRILVALAGSVGSVGIGVRW